MTPLGAADPPMTIARSFDRSYLSGSSYRACRTERKTVGTPAVSVTSSCSRSSRRLAASRFGPGIISLAPTRTEAKGRPQALTWNMGTTGSTQSASERERVAHRHHHGVEYRRAVRVEGPLGASRRPRGVAHRRRLVLVELGVLEVGLLGRPDQVLIGDHTFLHIPALCD